MGKRKKANRAAKVDVVGLGLNATDTVVLVGGFPALGGKERVLSVSRQAGGQVATALVTCQRLGLRTRYIGKVGDDEAGRFQLASLRGENSAGRRQPKRGGARVLAGADGDQGMDLRYVRVARNAPNQMAYIVLDQSTGERTVFWNRDPRLAIAPRELSLDAITSARVLHLDGCDVAACLQAARWARQAGVTVVADLDTPYKQVEKLFPFIDYLIASSNFLPAVTGEADPFRVLRSMSKDYRVKVAGMTLGRDGALAYSQGRFLYSPGFVVETVDTTGAGDVFHGAFIFGLLQDWPLSRVLDFSNAAAALNCTALGARGGIATEAAAERLVETGRRHANPRYLKA